MNPELLESLLKMGLPAEYLPFAGTLVGVSILVVLFLLSYYLAKHQLLVAVHKLVVMSKNSLDDLLVHNRVFSRLALLVPFILVLYAAPLILLEDAKVTLLIVLIAKVGICFQVAFSISAFLNVVKSAYSSKAKEKYLPLEASVQVIKLIVFLVAIIMAISIILDRSPVYLLSGLGALTAVILLVFQDAIKGLVASIQISANRMVAPGDWIELPKYGADGDVLEIGLTTVKVQNFDKTVTAVPTYALISDSFKNWRDMYRSGGRRIKRSILVDISSIHFYDQAMIDQLQDIALLQPYLAQKTTELNKDRSEKGVDETNVNARKLTNIGTFRAYIEAFLHQHPMVHPEMTCMVRQLKATEYGLPLELYFFSKDYNWVNYENIQADIFDHIYAMAAEFSLRIYQRPSGFDWQK
ncbi:mechanosensitive ion channel family protein [Thalassotalea agarivorans]|uniref:Mechanosensing system component YbdG n=1 Tax=Thalassotalea agarivorans TaxID=349064 RepID=A0A1I0CPX9_THASX|nr:mechanosensitive ion channel family protein [Thalassotalea agarivorans]SET21571.1 miniconductance mechanosensitive channel [Thalassotalea agarivorans]